VDFALRYRAELFPDVPIVFVANSPPAAVLRGEVPGVTGLVRDPSQAQTLQLALKLHPRATRIHVVAYAPLVDGYQERVAATLTPAAHGLMLTYANEATLADALVTIRRLPADSLLFYARYSPITTDRVMLSDEVFAQIAAASPVPIYSSSDNNLGRGVLGGMMRSEIEMAARIGQITLRILEGSRPETFPIESARLAPMFDWRQIQRWGLNPALLPPGAEIRFRVPTVWELYGVYIAAASVVMIAQVFLIAGLLYQRRARQLAELDSRRNLALAADANRRQTMSALTSSIAHEIGQPLSAMIHNAQALQMMIAANQATPETTGEILTDIRTQGLRATQIIDRNRQMLRSHQMDKKPIDLHAVVNESLAIVAHELRARRIETIVDLSATPCVVSGDQVLLQQVLLNMVMNAIDSMDGMAGASTARRQITIGTEIQAAQVAISVRDTGTGVSADLNGDLFTPFVTTKSKGLGIGLTIARTIVEEHGGTIDARNNTDGGATFTVTLPCGDTQTTAGG
jgi:signal transduction histidine kinase